MNERLNVSIVPSVLDFQLVRSVNKTKQLYFLAFLIFNF